jgi:hypothetical protein
MRSGEQTKRARSVLSPHSQGPGAPVEGLPDLSLPTTGGLSVILRFEKRPPKAENFGVISL